MKQFQFTTRSGKKCQPDDIEGVIAKTMAADHPILYSLPIGQKLETPYGSWERLPDLVLQDDVPLTSEDFAACRESAVRVRYKLRLERIATAVLSGLLASPNMGRATGYTSLAEEAVTTAKALIAELDKQS